MGVLNKIRATPTGRLALKIGIGVLGGLVIALGIILIPFPGPGWGIVILGLAIWAIEFAWAKHLLEFTKRHVKAWTSWIGRQSLPIRGLLGVACLLFVAGVVWASVRVSLGVDLVQMTREWLS
ncbi:TIGR02611 family protein [Actinoplanes sp. KI2]|uniref:TIGR02611 family protein n=1 Tax=Actinoplanes sp. KI2 TaxID=2983315 RepID=UPI0021D5E1C4|nr:TIGR02611 family protein [Actinoplanes sp. KI2]MCU7725621.1 TIGR02611 family protein [Actinoplanes sp. KI2]